MPKSIFESDIEKATSELNVTEDWQLLMDLCDRIKSAPNGPKESLKCIMKRVNHAIPHVAMQALTLLGACINNCGRPFHLGVSSREWTNEAKTIITRGHEKVSEKIRELIQKWAEDFKDDPQLNLMVQFYKKLKSDGFGFEFAPSSTSTDNGVDTSSKAKVNAVDFQEDLDLAIAMSLHDAETSKAPSASLYPSVSASAPVPSQGEREVCKVRALYDFEAAEDNEMTFKAGEVFSVLDNSDQNWWKGRNQHGIGLFPANFVTTDLSEEKSEKKKVRFADTEGEREKQTSATKKVIKPKVIINDEQLDLTLSMLKNASPNEIDDEEETICSMEESAREMGTLIEKKMLESERQKDDLNDLNNKFLEALSMYQQLMKEPMNVAPQPAPPVYQQTSPRTSLQQQQQQYSHPRFQQQYASTHFSSPVASGYQAQCQIQSEMANYSSQNPTNVIRQQPASLPPYLSLSQQTLSQQPSSLPPQPVSVPQQPISYSQQPQSLPYDFSPAGYGQQQYDSGQLYGNENSQYAGQQTEYMSYGYNPQQNTQTYQQTPVYQ